MNHNIYIYIFIMFAVSFLLRVLPLTLIRRKIENPIIQSFLYYVPYVTLAVMTFPAIMEATREPLAGILALGGGILAAAFGFGLFPTAIVCSLIVFMAELL